MSAARVLLAALSLAARLAAEGPRGIGAPAYSTDGIVNAASNLAGPLAPNTIATIYGANLAYETRAVQPEDISAGGLPTVLAGARVGIGGMDAPLLYVSPGQINFVVPYILIEGETELFVIRDGTHGPQVKLMLGTVAPAVFSGDQKTVVATSAEGRLITADSPARAGDIIVLYATGLGRTAPDQVSRRLADAAAPIRRIDELRVLLEGEAMARESILYAGVTPGFMGLYQINLQLPASMPANPELRIAIGEVASPPGLRLPTK